MRPFHTQSRKLLAKYHNFDDGLVTLFRYMQSDDCPPSAKVMLYARNHERSDNEWNHVEISMNNVEELCMTVSQKQFLPILLGIRILDFAEVYCVDVDGNYASTLGPESLTEVRTLGDFYFIGKEIFFNEIRQGEFSAKHFNKRSHKTSLAHNNRILSLYQNFASWNLTSFSCHQGEDELLSVKIVVKGKKTDSQGERSSSVEIFLHDAHDAYIKLRDNQFDHLTSGIRLFQFGALYCVDIAGSYTDSDLPHSFADVKRSGNCYALGGSVSITELLPSSLTSTLGRK